MRDNSANPPTMGIGCDMTGGSSGGGWVVGNDVLSVNSYGYSNAAQRDVRPLPGHGRAAALHERERQLSERVIVRSPEPGGTLPPGGALRVAFKVEPGLGVARGAAAGRRGGRHRRERRSASRARSRRAASSCVYAPDGGWAPGEHEAAVARARRARRTRWTFTVS